MFQIIKKIIRNQIRNPKWFLFLLIFPIFLMVLIGSILSGAFSDKSNLTMVDVALLNQSEGISAEVLDALSSASVSIEEDYGIRINYTDTLEDGKREARVNKKVFVHMNKDKMQVYGNESEPLNTARVVALFRSVACSIQTVKEAYKIDGENALQLIGTDNANYEVAVEMIPSENALSSYDYYGVAELTLMVLYLMLIPLGDLFTDKRTKVKDRIMLTGLSRGKYYAASLIAYSLIGLVVFIPAFIFSITYLDVNWGAYPPLMYLYIVLFAIFNAALGMLIAKLLKSRGKVDVLLSVLIIPIFSFLGGSYTPFPYDMEGTFAKVLLVSPLRWANIGIFRSIYADDNGVLFFSAAAFALLTLLCLLVIIVKDKREELKA
ncbi:ABC transporter permease ['Paenibacillus yunnanensis' Narsing Rao et al. 2020]|uniref:ABC transporter permease n=1 Tax=Paenibacillus tengchongensis TaxID=2608684 RepID=UPI00124EB8EA|nr:ABC transporter permease [Paenibacillus tengchongensis]